MTDCVVRFGPLIRSLARERVQQRSDLDDAVQEVLIELWRSAGRFDPAKGSETTFVATIARRRLIDSSRRARRDRGRVERERVAAASRTAAPSPPSRADVEAVAEAFRQLRPEQQLVLGLALRQGSTHEEIAATTGLPLGTVKTHARRGLIRLRRLVAKAGGEVPATIPIDRLPSNPRRLRSGRAPPSGPEPPEEASLDDEPP